MILTMVNPHSRGKADPLVVKTFGERLTHGFGRRFACAGWISQLRLGKSKPHIYIFAFWRALILFGNRYISDIIRNDDLMFRDKEQLGNPNFGDATMGLIGDGNANDVGSVGGDTGEYSSQQITRSAMMVGSNPSLAQGEAYLAQFGF